MFISSYVDHESITTIGTDIVKAATTNPPAKKCHISVIKGVGPDSSILHIIAISPVPSVGLIRLAMSHEAVKLCKVLDMDKPSPIQLTLSPSFQPIVFNFREQVLMAFLKFYFTQ